MDDYFAASSAPPPAAASTTYPPPAMAPTALSPDEQQLVATGAATSRHNMDSPPPAYSVSGPLGFMGSIRVGFQLLPVCWRVLTAQPSLLVVPFVVLVAGLLAVLGYVDAFGGPDNLLGPNKYAVAIKCFPLTAMLSVASVVGQAVIVAAATESLQGHRTSLGRAWVTAGSQLPRLVLFGVVYAGERTFTSLIRGRSRFSVGSIAANTIDRAWDFAAFLAIPVLLYENKTVFASVAQSGKLVAKRWGVQLTARSVLSLALFIVVLPLVLLGLVVIATTSQVLGIAIVAVSILGMIVTSAAMTGVLSAALYRFATTGQVAPGFNEAEMWSVFSRR